MPEAVTCVVELVPNWIERSASVNLILVSLPPPSGSPIVITAFAAFNLPSNWIKPSPSKSSIRKALVFSPLALTLSATILAKVAVLLVAIKLPLITTALSGANIIS